MHGHQVYRITPQTMLPVLPKLISELQLDLEPKRLAALNLLGRLLSSPGSDMDTSYPELPPGFPENHGREGTTKDGPEGFLPKSEYLSLFDAVRSATIVAVVAASRRTMSSASGEPASDSIMRSLVAPVAISTRAPPPAWTTSFVIVPSISTS